MFHITANVLLFDGYNNLITMEKHPVNNSPSLLLPNDAIPFSVNVQYQYEDAVMYVVLPSGIPQQQQQQ